MKIKRKREPARPVAAPAAQTTSNPRQFKSVQHVVSPDMIAFHYWREWFRARDRNDWDFMYAMSAEDSPLRAQLGERESFAELCRRRERSVPGLRDGELRKIRLDGPDVAQMFRVVGLDDRTQREVTIERWFMLRGPLGWNMIAVDEVRKGRTEATQSIPADWFEPIVLPEGFVGRSEREAEAAALPDLTATHPELV